MTEAEKTEVVCSRRATLRQLTQGLLDGPEQLRSACRYVLAHTGTDLLELPFHSEATTALPAPPQPQNGHRNSQQRFGLPEGFVPRRHRSGRTLLLAENIYRLPDGREYIPCDSSGSTQHLYALLTFAQFQQCQRGSVYILTDGRIFDYSSDEAPTERHIFDTGYTIADLKRTGKYATPPTGPG